MRDKHLGTASFEDLMVRIRDLPEGYRGQVLDGALVVSEPPSPARAHTLAEISAMFVAGSTLGDPVPEAWSFLANVELTAGSERLLACDVCGFQMTRHSLPPPGTAISVTPEWVCEVLGERDRRFALSAKRRAFAEMGVAHLWLADPDARVMDVFRNERGKWLLLASLTDESNVSVPPFAELHFDASDLWMPPVEIKSPPSSRRRAV